MSSRQTFDPIKSGFGSEPPAYPSGWPSIAERVSIETIKKKKRTADAIYEHYHSYLPRGRQGCHYGVLLDEQLVGSITFSAWPSQSTIRGYESAQIREVSRVCITNDTANLASCAMSKAQDRFVREHTDEIQLLTTYIRPEYHGSMFKALRGKGWEFDGVSEGSDRQYNEGQKEHEIYTVDKKRWVCEV